MVMMRHPCFIKTKNKSCSLGFAKFKVYIFLVRKKKLLIPRQIESKPLIVGNVNNTE